MKVKITKLAKNPMQSGLGKNNLWILSFFEESPTRSVNNLTGWTSSSNTKTQLKLKFRSKEDAINYAKDQKYEYIVNESNSNNIKTKSYSNNFTKPIIS